MKLDSYLAAMSRRKFIRQAACASLSTAAMSNCIRDLFLINSAMGADTTGYKALVCIFLSGGNDSNNLIIPTIPGEYTNYATIRTPVLAIPNADGSGAMVVRVINRRASSCALLYVDADRRRKGRSRNMDAISSSGNRTPRRRRTPQTTRTTQ